MSGLLKLLGPFPEKVQLRAEHVESVNCGKYTREEIRYNVERDERISAYVLVPKNLSSPLPAVFCHHQHAGDYEIGKSEVAGLIGDLDQAYAMELAERGYITFAPDAISFESRKTGDSPQWSNLFELSARLIEGKTVMAKVIHDVQVAIDYMVSRSDVDSERIGFIGHSYGGRMALWVPAFDNRIRVSVSNCGCSSYRYMLNAGSGVQNEFCVPGILGWGDLEDVICLMKATNLLILATNRDKWSLGAWALYEKCKSRFSGGELELKVWDGPHQFTEEMREYAYHFLDRHLGTGL
jgi:dienelactone hydrolase